MDPIKVWSQDGFQLELFDNYEIKYGKHILAYRFWDGEALIFEGADYGCSPMHAIDSDGAVAGLLAFLSLKPGDTDSEYFEDYSPEQMAWCQGGRAEQLGCWVCEMEEVQRG